MLVHIHSSKNNGSMRDIIQEHLQRDPSAKPIVELTKARKTRQFWIEGDLLLTKGNWFYVPKAGDLKKKLIQECHNTLWVSHSGQQPKYALVKKGNFWPNMRYDIMQYIKKCLVCQQDKVERAKVSSLLEEANTNKTLGECVLGVHSNLNHLTYVM